MMSCLGICKIVKVCENLRAKKTANLAPFVRCGLSRLIPLELSCEQREELQEHIVPDVTALFIYS